MRRTTHHAAELTDTQAVNAKILRCSPDDFCS
jgi:hypothetical protein